MFSSPSSESVLSRSTPLTRAVQSLLFVAWLICFAFAVRTCIRGTSYPPVYIRIDPGSEYPTVDESRLGPEFDLLQRDDLLLSWNGVSLRHADEAQLTIVVGETEPGSLAKVELERSGQRLIRDVPSVSMRRGWPRVAASVIFAATALLFAVRSQPTALVNNIVYALLAWAFLLCGSFRTPSWLPDFAGEIQILSGSAVAVFGTRVMMLFPNSVGPSRRWLLHVPFVFALMGPLDLEVAASYVLPRAFAQQLLYALIIALVAINAGLFVASYRRASPLERRQLKWLAWAIWTVSGTLMGFAGIVLAVPSLTHWYYIANTVVVLIPLALLIGILRFNHFDIDRILSATAALWLLIVVGSLSVPVLSAFFTGFTNPQGGVHQLGATAIASLLVMSCARWLSPRIDRFIFVERNALQRGIASLLPKLNQAPTRLKLLELMNVELSKLLKPECLAIYVVEGDVWPAVIVSGRGVPPLLSVHSRLSAICDREPVLSFERGRAWSVGDISREDAAFLQSIDARVVLTVRDARGPAAMVLIGCKGSGDVYVPSDLALLTSVSHVASERWAKCGRADEDAALRQYVPHELATRIEQGLAIEQGEREVTVLFIDIRGYSSYAEKREPKEVFSMVSEYTLAASKLLVQHGGTIVDFNGDGMMAVFGAPGDAPEKELAAVRAARDLLDTMRVGLPPAILAPVRTPIGVGVATGVAYVGCVRSADRQFWTALGAVTNRAARLQALTRDLDCDILIDKSTFLKLSTLQDEFELHPHMLLRGHVQRFDLYAYLDASSERAAESQSA